MYARYSIPEPLPLPAVSPLRKVSTLKYRESQPNKLPGSKDSFPVPPFRLICTVKSELKRIFDLYHYSVSLVDTCLFPVDGFDTRWFVEFAKEIWMGFSCFG